MCVCAVMLNYVLKHWLERSSTKGYFNLKEKEEEEEMIAQRVDIYYAELHFNLYWTKTINFKHTIYIYMWITHTHTHTFNCNDGKNMYIHTRFIDTTTKSINRCELSILLVYNNYILPWFMPLHSNDKNKNVI